MSSQISISEAARRWKVSRSTIQRKLKHGALSYATHSGTAKLVDISELRRVLGEARDVSIQAQSDSVTQANDTATNNLIQQLKDENAFLKEQIKKADDRDQKLLAHQTQSLWKKLFG